MNKFIRDKILELPAGSKILDGGCGLSVWVTDELRNKYKLYSMDSEKKSVEFCQHHYHDERCLVGDLYNIPFLEESFDAVSIREVIEHIRQPERAVQEIKRVLKKGGRLIVTTPNYGNLLLFFVENIYNRFFSEMKPYLDEVHPSKFKLPQLRRLLERHFILREYGTIDFGINLRAVAEKV